MKKVTNPHDKFFKETFSDVALAKDFIENYLPEEVLKVIELETLEPQKDSFIKKDLEEIFSDMLFKVKINSEEGYLYFLFEHKSYKAKSISFQLLKYMVEIWESKINKEKTYELPMIIPLVIYHGQGDWNIETRLGDLIVGYRDLSKEIQRYIPDYEYLIYDLSQYKDEDIKGEAQLRVALQIFRDIFLKDEEAFIESFIKGTKTLLKLEEDKTGLQLFETYLRYIMSARQDLKMEEATRIVKEISLEGSEVMMTILQEATIQGEKKGETKKAIEVAKNMIKKGMEIEDIVEITGLKKEEVEKLKSQALN